MASTDDQSQAQARRQSNLAFAFKIAGLDADRRRAMEIFYTFCRVADDIVDEEKTDEEKTSALDQWRASVRGFFAAPGGTPPHDQLAEEMAGIVRRYQIPMAPLLAILDGCAMDIGTHVYSDAAELHRYCYGVACAVGLASIRIFGCTSPRSEEFAVALGYALQFTNILRDLVEDYHELGRIYLPRDEMAAFGVAPEDLAAPAGNPCCRRLFQLQYFRAKHYFNKARRLVTAEDRDALKAAFVMGAFYEAILEKIKAHNFQLTPQRIRLSKWQKLLLLRRTLREGKRPFTPPNPPRHVRVIGGGIAGISAAIATAQAGHTVELHEGKPSLGGRAGSFFLRAADTTIDHGHHALFGCYAAFFLLADTLGLNEKLAHADRLDVPYRTSGRKSSRLRAGKIPLLHLLPALLGFSEISWRDRLAILRFGIALRLGNRPRPAETAAAWLARLGQTPGAIRALWEPFCVAALNLPLAEADAALFFATIRRTLFGGVRDSAIVTSRVPLGELFSPEAEIFLRAVGGQLHLRSQVREVLREENPSRATAIRLADGSILPADAVILATPWKTAARLLPASDPAKRCGEISGEPILNIHLFSRKKISPEPLFGLLDSPWQWIFDVTKSGAPSGIFHYALTMSCPGEWMKKSAEEIIQMTRAELEKIFPETAPLDLAHAQVCKCPDATFSARPATAALRPSTHTATPNLFLAGDWIATGLPATIEGAAQSGQMAAAALDEA